MKNSVVKGWFSIVATGEKVPFVFNPPIIRDQQGVSFPDQSVPGMSHPVTQYAGGGPRLISFELYLDGDRGHLGRTGTGELQNHSTYKTKPQLRPRQSNFEVPGAPSKSIQAELEFYRSLRYPAHTEGDGMAQISPHLILFTFGPLFDAVPCCVMQMDIEVTYWNINLEPVRAELKVMLKEVVSRSVSRSSVFSPVSEAAPYPALGSGSISGMSGAGRR